MGQAPEPEECATGDEEFFRREGEAEALPNGGAGCSRQMQQMPDETQEDGQRFDFSRDV